ncbi:BRCT domain-containing protein, partial [Singulisphaera rosea]
MSTHLRMDDVRLAWQARDPELSELVVQLAGQEDDDTSTPPPREGALTFAKLLIEIRSRDFARKPLEEQAIVRVERFKALEAPGAEVPPPERLRLHEVVLALWENNGPYARAALLKIIAEVPLSYGPWKALKTIFKEAEARDDTEVFGALAARIDGEGSGPWDGA